MLLSPQVFLLGILFRHQAFQARALTSPEDLDKLDIHPGENEMPLPLVSDIDDVYIFRTTVQNMTGYELSPNTPITYGAMAAWIRTIGKVLGIEDTVIMYSLRYNTGNKLDQSRMYEPPFMIDS